MRSRTRQLFDRPPEVVYPGVQVRLGRGHRLVPQERLRGAGASRSASEVVGGRVAELVHRVADNAGPLAATPEPQIDAGA